MLSLGLDLGGDPWNAGVRGRWTSMGDATFGVRPHLLAGRDWKLGELGLGFVAWGGYTVKLGRIVEGSAGTFRAPADEVSGGLTVNLDPAGRTSFELGASGMQRLWGLDWDDAYFAEYFPTDDRWTVLWYEQVAAGAKVSVALTDEVGLHVGVQRVLVTCNGPPDTSDFTIGVHKVLPPRG